MNKIKWHNGTEDGLGVYVVGLGKWHRSSSGRGIGLRSRASALLELVFSTLEYTGIPWNALLHPASIYMLSAQGRCQLLSIVPRDLYMGVWWGTGEKGAVYMHYLHMKFLASVVLWQKLLVILAEMMVTAWKLPWGPSVLPGRRCLCSVLIPHARSTPQTPLHLEDSPGTVSCHHNPSNTWVSLFMICLGISRAQYRIDT